MGMYKPILKRLCNVIIILWILNLIYGIITSRSDVYQPSLMALVIICVGNYILCGRFFLFYKIDKE